MNIIFNKTDLNCGFRQSSKKLRYRKKKKLKGVTAHESKMFTCAKTKFQYCIQRMFFFFGQNCNSNSG